MNWSQNQNDHPVQIYGNSSSNMQKNQVVGQYIKQQNIITQNNQQQNMNGRRFSQLMQDGSLDKKV